VEDLRGILLGAQLAGWVEVELGVQDRIRDKDGGVTGIMGAGEILLMDGRGGDIMAGGRMIGILTITLELPGYIMVRCVMPMI
jgi:hypothetical protein